MSWNTGPMDYKDVHDWENRVNYANTNLIKIWISNTDILEFLKKQLFPPRQQSRGITTEK